MKSFLKQIENNFQYLNESVDIKSDIVKRYNQGQTKSQIIKAMEKDYGHKFDKDDIETYYHNSVGQYDDNPEPKRKKSKTKRWQDNDGDGIWYEPGVDVKAEAVDQNHDGKNDWDDIRMAKMVASGDYVKCDKCKGKGCDHCDGTGLHKTTNEMSTTAAVAPITTPNAFSPADDDTVEALGYKRVQEAMDRKYEQLIEGYKSFALGNGKRSPNQTVNASIREVAKKLKEIEETIKYTSRLKTESGISHSGFSNGTRNALTKISERLIKISERVRSLGE